MSESKEAKSPMVEPSKPSIPYPKVLPKPAIKRLRVQGGGSATELGQIPKTST